VISNRGSHSYRYFIVRYFPLRVCYASRVFGSLRLCFTCFFCHFLALPDKAFPVSVEELPHWKLLANPPVKNAFKLLSSAKHGRPPPGVLYPRPEWRTFVGKS
jgi:hypothetical protein